MLFVCMYRYNKKMGKKIYYLMKKVKEKWKEKKKKNGKKKKKRMLVLNIVNVSRSWFY